MAGRPKRGIDYSSWSVDIFDSDTKIDKLLDSKGWIGFGIYFYLCQRAYGSDGYFYKWSYDDCATTARKMGGGINSGTVKETVSYCLQIDLFDKRLFDRWGVLTSRGIQRRYWVVLSERRSKTVYGEYWLLADKECKGLVKVGQNNDVQPSNGDYEPANDDVQAIKESKVKDSKEKEIKEYIDTAAPSSGCFANQELEQAFQLFVVCRERKTGEILSAEQIQLLREELCGISDRDNDRLAVVKKATVNSWKSFYPLKKTGKKKESGNRFNNIEHRDYNMDSLEGQLLNADRKEREKDG